MNFCTSETIQIVEMIGIVLKIFKFCVPLILIVIGIFDFYKAVVSPDNSGLKKSSSRFIKRIIAAILIFLLPSIINICFGFIGVEESDCTKCLLDSNKCKITTPINNNQNNINKANGIDVCANLSEEECKNKHSECKWKNIEEFNLNVNDQSNYCVNTYFNR